MSNDFSPISYKRLVNRLKRVKFDYRDDIRRKVIYDEFILHVEEHIMSKKSKSITDQTRLYLEYKDTIEKLTHYFNKDSVMVFEEFEGMIKNIFQGDEWQIRFKQNRGYHQVYKRSWEIERVYKDFMKLIPS